MRYTCVRIVNIALLFVWLVAFASPATAWQRDVHHDLTLWLATKAGFSPTAARIVAAADQGYDDSAHHAAVSSMVWLLLSGDAGAARDIQLKHFPSDVALPSSPQQRAVAPNSIAARINIESAVEPNTLLTAAVRFGEALHPFQDSWSHAGIPDVPLRPFGPQIRPDLAFGHPKARGGWRSHDADLTHLHVDEVEHMASETYKLMQNFLANNQRFSSGKPVDWTVLRPVVRQFAAAAMEAQKSAWSRKFAVAVLDAPYASMTSQSETAVAEVITPTHNVPREEVPSELILEAQKFLNAWLAQQNVVEASKSLYPRALKSDFAELPNGLWRDIGDDPDASIMRWCQKFMVSYLVANHDLVNALGHGDPTVPGYFELPETVGADTCYVMRAVQPPQVDSLSFGSIGSGDTKLFALAIRISDLPHDAVGLVWELREKKWRIVRILGVVG